MFGYRVPKPDEVMLVSGRKSSEEQPFKIYRQGKFVLPGFRYASMLTTKQQKSMVDEPCTTVQGINGIFKAVVAFRIAPDDASIYAAGQRFREDQGVDRKTGVAAMAEQTGQIFAGHLRSIVGAMTLEDIMQKRQALADEVLSASKLEVARMGLQIDSFQLTSIEGEQVKAYVAAMAAPHTSRVQQQARVAQAEADRIAAEAEQSAARQRAEYQRDTSIAEARYKAETDKAAAEAAQAGPLAEAQAQQAVIDMQREQAQRESALREQELITEVQRPAEAEAQRVRIQAKAQADQAVEQARQMTVTATAQAERDVTLAKAAAQQTELSAQAQAKSTEVNGAAEAGKIRAKLLAEAEGERAKADALAANESVQLRLAQTEIVPEVARALSGMLQGSNVTMLNGAEDWSKLIAVGAQQVKALLSTFAGSNNGEVHTNGQSTPQGEIDKLVAQLETK
jgi:flotillin